MPLRVLYLDMSSFFASVEQQLRPELRGRPVVVVPMDVDSTCCIAASYQARQLGIRTGTPVGAALDSLAHRSGLPIVSRFAEGMAVAIERGTPLAAVLHAQAGDVREAGRRALIESGARKEIAMMVPVVFLVLPVTIVFAFWPGVVGLHLVTP